MGILFLLLISSITGNKIRLVTVATNKVKDVNQPNAWVPPKPLKQKITNPAISTMDVYKILKPVCLMEFK